jgi:hypothetical protein
MPRDRLFNYYQSNDPGTVGAGRYWLDSTDPESPVLKRRNEANSAWLTIATGGEGGGGDYTDEMARDAIGTALVAGNNIDITVDDGANTITIDVEALTKADVGLANVDNTSDANKPVSTATQTALDLKADATHDHDADYAAIGHDHDADYAAISHTHTLANISDVTASAAEVNLLDGVTASTAELNILDGVTATAAELNALDGITATVTELNFTDGVTSAIQTQIDGKAATGHNHDAAYAAIAHNHDATYQPLDTDLTQIAGLVDPNADRLLFWDDSAGSWTHLTLGTNLSITGTTINAAAGGGSATITEVEVDFGTTPTGPKTFTVVDAALSTSSVVMVTQSGATPTDGFGGEAELDPILFTATPETGQMTVAANPRDGRVVGKFKLNYLIGD